MGDRLRAGLPPRYVASQLGQLILASLWVWLNRVPAALLRCDKDGNVTPLPGGS